MTVLRFIYSFDIDYKINWWTRFVMGDYSAMVTSKKKMWVKSMAHVNNMRRIRYDILNNAVWQAPSRTSLKLFSHELAHIMQRYMYPRYATMYWYILDTIILRKPWAERRLEIEANKIEEHLVTLTPMGYHDYLKQFIDDYINKS